MDNEKDLLIASAARLYSMGIDLEAARDQLRQLVEQGVPNKEGNFRLRTTHDIPQKSKLSYKENAESM